jgi:two-component system response regulator ResD
VAEDDSKTADIIRRYLARAGFDPLVASNGHLALAQASSWRPDLLLLDVMLPGLDGLEVLHHLREGGMQMPVILVTARGEEADRVGGLRGGADDYVVKPFSPDELVARVEAVLRRVTQNEDGDTPITVDELEIHPAGRRVFARGAEVALTQREFDLLLFLASNRGKVFTRNQLMTEVWRVPYYSDTSTVTVHVGRLRTKLEDDPGRPHYVETVWGVGYRFRP